MRVLRSMVLLLALTPPGAWAGDTVLHPIRLAQPETAPDDVLLVVEIPAGGAIKYELGEDGELRVDRFLSMPVAYPANYGSMPRTLAGDGDPLDALVLTRFPIQPGAVVRFRPLGVLRMVDRGQADEKIVGVPSDAVDPSYSALRTLQDLPAMERERIEAFFRVYKQLPAGARIELHGWGDAGEARQLIRAAMQRFGQTSPAR